MALQMREGGPRAFQAAHGGAILEQGGGGLSQHAAHIASVLPVGSSLWPAMAARTGASSLELLPILLNVGSRTYSHP